MDSRRLTRGAMIAGIYIVITYILSPVSFGPLQFRVSEALSVLPIIYPEAIPALFIGVFFANILGGLGIIDIVCGSLITLIAAYFTYYFRENFLAYLSPVIFNGFLVSLYLHKLFGLPYLLTAAEVAISEAVVVFLFGYPLIKYLQKKRKTP